MTNCCAYNCHEKHKKGGLSFHSFPQDPELRKKWLKLIRREDFTPTKYSRLCSKHFQREDFDLHFGSHKLKKGAIPSVFDEDGSTKPKQYKQVQKLSELCSKHLQREDFDAHFGSSKLKKRTIPSLFGEDKSTKPKQYKKILPRTSLPPEANTNSTLELNPQIINIIVKSEDNEDQISFPKAVQISGIHTIDPMDINSRNSERSILELNSANDNFVKVEDDEDQISFHKNIQISDIHSIDAFDINSGYSERANEAPVSHTRRKFTGDYKLSDMSSPEMAKKFFESATATIRQKNDKINVLRRRASRLEKRLKDLSSVLKLCREKMEEYAVRSRQVCATSTSTMHPSTSSASSAMEDPEQIEDVDNPMFWEFLQVVLKRPQKAAKRGDHPSRDNLNGYSAKCRKKRNTCAPTSTLPPHSSPELNDPEQIEESANTMFREYWEIELNSSPESATMLGDHRYDDRLDSYSLKCYEKRKVVLSEFLEQANQMLPLAKEGSFTHNNLELFVINLRNKLDDLMSGSYLFPVSRLQTPQMNLQYLLKYAKLNATQDYWNLLSRYRSLPAQVDEQIELMREGIRTNFTLNEHSITYNLMGVDESAEDTPFYKPFSNISSFVRAEDRAAIQVNASDAIRNCILPAFEKLCDFLKNEYKQHLRPGIGVDQLPNGREYYRQQLAHHLTDSTITPEEVHQMGLSEVERISKEMDQVIASLNPNLTRQEFTEQLRNDTSNFFTSEEEVLETYRSIIDDVIKPKLPLLFKSIPQKKLTVEKSPADMATGPRAYYLRPSPDGSTPATFVIDALSFKDLPRYEVVTLSLHEGVPGHHLQITYAMERSDVPDFRKYGLWSAFTEGWALYSEYLGKEMGLYSDPKMWYGHLSEEIFRACRMVVDSGMHVFGWSRQQAIDYMLNNSASTLSNIEREVDRYITWPGQACAYKFGEIKIKELRQKAENKLGSNFDIKEFHDVVLRNNGPLELLEKQVDRYIATTKKPTVKS